MEMPGFAPNSGQPTATNPLSSQAQLIGQKTQAQQGSEAANTVTSSEQAPSSLTSNQVVEQTTETQTAGFNAKNPGGTIDFTA